MPRKTAVLVTGCSSGIGEATALRLLQLGFLVFASVRQQKDADALKKKAGNSNSHMLHLLLMDVTNAAHIAAAVDAVKARLAKEDRRLLALVSNAGGPHQSPLELLPLDDLRAQLELNVLSHVALTRAFLPLLRSAASPAHSARLVFVGSIAGRFAIPGLAAYSASKSALEATTDAFRMELRRWNVETVLIEPGQMATRFAEREAGSGENGEGMGEGGAAGGLYEGVRGKFFHRLLFEDRVGMAVDAVEWGVRGKRPLARILAGWTSLPTLPYLCLPTDVADPVMGFAYR